MPRIAVRRIFEEKTMRTLLLLLTIVSHSFTQNSNEQRSGFTFGLAFGGGSLRLNTNDTVDTRATITLPNIKAGYFLRPDLEMVLLLPGANYRYQGKPRGFESAQIGAQYWPAEGWWVLGAIGLTFDAPAFYTVSDPSTAAFYIGGPTVSIAGGKEIFRWGATVWDVQYRFFTGRSHLPNDGSRDGVSNMLMLGVNWY